MDQPRIERAIQLMMVLANNRYATNDEICRRFDISERTFFRYVDTFRQAGFVVKKNENRVYRLETSMNKLTRHLSDLLHFSEEEEFLLRAAIDSIESTTQSRKQLKKKLYALYDYKVIADLAVPRRDMKTFHDLKDAVDGHRQAILKDYQSAHSNTTTDRLVEPYAFTEGLEQVWCYEVETQSVKTFKISRISSVQVQETPWQYEGEHRTGYVDVFRMHSTQRFPIRLRLSLRAANLLMEEYPLSRKYLTQAEDNRYLLETEVCSFEGVTRFILGLYNDVEILESADLKKFVQYKMQMMHI